MNTPRTTNPISIPRTSRSSSLVDLDIIHFSPPELRERVETTPNSPVPDEMFHRIENISKSLPIEKSRLIGGQFYPSTKK